MADTSIMAYTPVPCKPQYINNHEKPQKPQKPQEPLPPASETFKQPQAQ